MHYKCDMKIGASGPGLLELCPFVILLCVITDGHGRGYYGLVFATFHPQSFRPCLSSVWRECGNVKMGR